MNVAVSEVKRDRRETVSGVWGGGDGEGDGSCMTWSSWLDFDLLCGLDSVRSIEFLLHTEKHHWSYMLWPCAVDRVC